MRLLRLLPIRIRAALAAALATAAVLGVSAWWIGDQAYRQELPTARHTALKTALRLDDAVPAPNWEDALGWRDRPLASYVLLLADGTVARTDIIGNLDELTALLPPPPPMPDLAPDAGPSQYLARSTDVSITAPPHVFLRMADSPDFSPPDPDVTFVRYQGRTWDDKALEALTGRPGLPAQQVTVYVLVDDAGPRAQAARLTGILLRYVLPFGSLFVALVAWLVVGFALRPVEAIRRQMARIGGGDLHERVPVPPARDQIGRLAATTNETLDRLADALAEQRRLVADASHELRTPVAVLRGSLDVALAHPERADWPSVARTAVTGAERLERLTGDLLLLHRVDERAGPDRLTPLHDLITEQVAERAFLGRPPVEVLALDEVLLPAGESLLGRLVGNLLDNAERYAASRITLALRATGGTAELTVADDGPGIAAADRERVFERFVRLDESRDRLHGGSGLGLALVRGIAEGLGGTATAVAPATGHGAELLVSIPVPPAGGARSYTA
ncbi:sensor histidine kinase [Kitasatospora sp. NPDC051853]|uniref:sensor histidine kinase n=1 Tax=Kitasatospora sp. NPDC051853 TaxID=3364058 RepID=UPI00379E058A